MSNLERSFAKQNGASGKMPDDNSPHDVFISYSRKDLKAVERIKNELDGLGFSCWIDLKGIESGSRQFSQKIIAAIDASSAVLFFLSADSQVSEWALKEIDYAYDEKKHVVLVRFNDDRMTKQFRFDFNRADIIDWRRAEQKKKLVGDLRRWTGQIKQARVPNSHATASSTTGVAKKKEPKQKSKDALVACPICGKKNNPEGTFQCRECGRDNLCLRHQDDKTYLCCDCVSKAMNKKGGHSSAIQGESGLSCPSVEVRGLGDRHARVTNAAKLLDMLESAVEEKYKTAGCRVQRLPFEQGGNGGALIQIQPHSSNMSRYLSMAMGVDYCVSVKLLRVGADLEIKVFAGKWINKVFAAVASWFVLWPLTLGAFVGAYRLKKFLDAIYDDVIQWVSSNRADAH